MAFWFGLISLFVCSFFFLLLLRAVECHRKSVIYTVRACETFLGFARVALQLTPVQVKATGVEQYELT